MTLGEKIAIVNGVLLVTSEGLAAIKSNIVQANSLWQVVRDLIMKRSLTPGTSGEEQTPQPTNPPEPRL